MGVMSGIAALQAASRGGLVAGTAGFREAPAPAGVLRVLGDFSLELRDVELDAGLWRRAHARRLVQLLASSPKMSEARDKLLVALWPDSDVAHARNRLHHTVHWIRQGLEPLPQALRPRLDVGVERISLVLPDDFAVDAQIFLSAADEDSPDDASRLTAVERAIAWYRDDFALDWLDVPDVDARRAWLAGRFDALLAEAVQLCVDMEHAELAVEYAHRRALRPGADMDAHCDYASLLADNGQTEAAVRHCQSVREAVLLDEDAAAVKRLDELTRDVQQRANRGPQTRKTVEPDRVELRAPVATVARRVPLPPRQRLLGYEKLLDAVAKSLSDAYASCVTLMGPPGAGKTAIAKELAHRLEASFRHGAVWVDCRRVGDEEHEIGLAVLAALGLETRAQADTTPTQAVLSALHGSELLLVLDGLECTESSHSARALSRWLAANRDLRCLLSSRLPCRIQGEKHHTVDPTELLESTDSAVAPPATQLVARAGVHSWNLQDQRIRATVQAIARSVDGLPILLEAQGELLENLWPNELLSSLDRDVTLLLHPRQSQSSQQAASTESLVAWVRTAPDVLKPLLAVAGRCRSWLTRDDLAVLWACEAGDINALIDRAMRLHLMLRRVRQTHDGAWSEFRVPRYVLAALAMLDDNLPASQAQSRIASWLIQSSRSVNGPIATAGAPNQASTVTSWFDDHIEDFSVLANDWQLLGRHAELASLCAAQRQWFAATKYPALVLEWLVSLGESMDAVPDDVALILLNERCRLRARLGALKAAFEDAGHVLARLGPEGDMTIRQEALAMIERYGLSQASGRRPEPLSAKGIEAGESLLRIALMALRHGELNRALQLSGEAIGVFTYFGLPRGLIKAHQLRARVVFALGDTALAHQCIDHAERAAHVVSDRGEAACAELMRAALLVSEMQFQRAISTASALMARPELGANPTFTAKGLLVLGWANYALGALPLARAIVTELREQCSRLASEGLRTNVDMLAALLDARQGARAIAVRRVGELLDTPGLHRDQSDFQGSYVNAAELLIHLNRPDLAGHALDQLDIFSGRPDHRLRPWVAHRAQTLRASIVDVVVGGHAAMASRGTSINDLFATLVAS